MNKLFISADALLNDSFTLAKHILASDFKPSFIIGVWRGGTPVASAVHEYFAFNNIATDHIAIRASSYSDIDKQHAVALFGMNYVYENINADSRILLVDDVYDTGKSMNAITEAIHRHLPSLSNDAIKIATPWLKPTRNQTQKRPDFYLHETEQWLVFPHELCGLSRQELIAHKQFLANIQDLV